MNEPARIRILSVDDHALVREGLATVINDQPDMQVVADAATGGQAIAQFTIARVLVKRGSEQEIAEEILAYDIPDRSPEALGIGCWPGVPSIQGSGSGYLRHGGVEGARAEREGGYCLMFKVRPLLGDGRFEQEWLPPKKKKRGSDDISSILTCRARAATGVWDAVVVDVEMAFRIHYASYGLIGCTMKIIRGAVRIARCHPRQQITMRTLSQSFAEHVWSERLNDPNPFLKGFDPDKPRPVVVPTVAISTPSASVRHRGARLELHA